MNFNANQLTSFFTNNPQMALSPDQRLRLGAEGLVTVEDFADFKEDQLEDAIKNLRTPIPGVPRVLNAEGNEIVAAVPAVPPCLISAKCTLRLKIASIAYHYYVSIGHVRTPVNMNYTNVLHSFHVEWEAIKKLAEEDKPGAPTLSRHVTTI